MINSVFSNNLSALAKSSSSEWILEQSEEMGGFNRVFISHDAVKIVNTTNGSHILTKAPDWKVHAFQPKEKVEWVGDMTLFSGIVMTNPYASTLSPYRKKLKAVEIGTFNGLKFTKFVAALGCSGITYGADEISISPEGAEFLARFYNLGYTAKVPLFHSVERVHNPKVRPKKPTQWIDTTLASDLRSGNLVCLTTKSWKKIPYRKSDFDLPVGFKRAGDIAAVTFSPDKKSEISDLVDSIGFTSSTGKDEKKTSPAKH
jgi:hypothetical protein